MTVREVTVQHLQQQRIALVESVRDAEWAVDNMVEEDDTLVNEMRAADKALAMFDRELKYHTDITRAEAQGWTKEA